jgi:membrane protein implicated in regulation of membrane protease activity
LFFVFGAVGQRGLVVRLFSPLALEEAVMEVLGSYKIFWFIVGFTFLILEVLTPGVVFIFFGAGAWLVLLLTFFMPTMPAIIQWLVFAASSVVFLVILRRHVAELLARRESGRGDSLKDPLVADQYLGREAQVISPIKLDRAGQVEFNGTNWQARSQHELSAGTMVRVVEIDGLTLWVEPASGPPEPTGGLEL